MPVGRDLIPNAADPWRWSHAGATCKEAPGALARGASASFGQRSLRLAMRANASTPSVSPRASSEMPASLARRSSSSGDQP
ncbi:uncharacterized protein SOCEGT47_041890 [Sorangium cellulosum]|uniref:Uncharacterized protein n=1 Tax=Sorangium cellulosum TaxID=56 RepID=A0A4P2Q3E2_SORCE|nr:uncharacterized protein SOCEGT47_041890 [Sorangium cellulosum]